MVTQSPQAEAAQARAQAAEARAAEAAARAEAIARVVQERVAAQTGVVTIQPGGAGSAIMVQRPSSPAAIYEAQKEMRDELRNQLRRLEEQREEFASELQSPNLPAEAKNSLVTRLNAVDGRITSVESQLADADAAVARAAAVPGAVQPPPPRPRDPGPPEEFWVITTVFIIFVLMPIAVAYARRIWKRSSSAIAAIPQEIYDRFNRQDQAVDSIAIEVERVGEGQRYLTRVYAEQRGIGAGAAERVEMPERAAQKQGLK